MAAKRKIPPRSEWAESTRKKQSNWIKENRYKPSTNVPADVGETFRAYCAAQGKTVSAVLADYIYSIVGNPRAATAARDETENQQAENQPEKPDQ